jgi:hypothetical protein
MRWGFAPFGNLDTGSLATRKKVFNPTPGDSGGVDQESYIEKGNSWINTTYPGISFVRTAIVGV